MDGKKKREQNEPLYTIQLNSTLRYAICDMRRCEPYTDAPKYDREISRQPTFVYLRDPES